MLHPDDQSQVVSVSPPLAADEVELLAGLAGVGDGVRWVWPGQPGRRSPWLPCAAGCCLVVEERPGADPVAWLRFLIREVLAPRSAVPLARARRLGLPGGHRVKGWVLLDLWGPAPRMLVVSSNRVRVHSIDRDDLPGERERSRGDGEVVDLGRRRADDRDPQRTER